jgi:hypothetical protein
MRLNLPVADSRQVSLPGYERPFAVLRRTLDVASQELQRLNIDPTDMLKEMDKPKAEISKAEKHLSMEKKQAQQAISDAHNNF